MDATYKVFAFECSDKFCRVGLVSKVGRKKNFSIRYFQNFLPLNIHNGSFGKAAVVFYQQSQKQLLFSAAKRVETQSCGIIGKSLDLSVNEVANTLSSHSSE